MIKKAIWGVTVDIYDYIFIGLIKRLLGKTIGMGNGEGHLWAGLNWPRDKGIKCGGK